VRDAHGRARNILWDRLDPRARLISGWDPTADMLLGLDASFGLVMLIGYHPGPGVARGVLSHTFSSRILDLRLNDRPCNEAVIAALEAGTHGVPVGLVTGQEELRDEIRPALPEVGFVSTKRGLAYQAAILEPMRETRVRIREEARNSVSADLAGKGPKPLVPKGSVRLQMDLATAEAALALVGSEGVVRAAPRICNLEGAGAAELLRRFFKALQILYAVKDTP
jgi:D-amino peptidase